MDNVKNLQHMKIQFENYLKRSTKLSNKTIQSKIKAINDFILFVAIHRLIN